MSFLQYLSLIASSFLLSSLGHKNTECFDFALFSKVVPLKAEACAVLSNNSALDQAGERLQNEEYHRAITHVLLSRTQVLSVNGITR